MKNIFSFVLTAFAAILFFSACTNEKGTPDVPQIVIESPEEGATFQFGDTVHIEVDITHTVELHEYLVELKKVSDGSVLFSEGEHAHSTEAHVHDHWVNDVSTPTDMELIVTAEDHEGKTNTKNIHIHCHPH